MAVVKTIRGILTEKFKKEWEDGSKGFFCTILLPDESFLHFWAQIGDEEYLGEEQQVEGWDNDVARDFRITVKDWHGQKKYSLTPAKL